MNRVQLKSRNDQASNDNEISDGILPPGMELISTTSYGQFTIQIGDLIYLNSPLYPSDQVRIRVKFWGEKGSGKIYRARNSSIQLCDMYPCTRTYNVCCQMEQFYKYLQDMSKLRLAVTDNVNKVIGYATLDILSHLKSSLGFSDFCPFDDIECVLPIISVKKDQQKIGEIQVLIESCFDSNKSQFIRDFSETNTLLLQDQGILQQERIQNQRIQNSTQSVEQTNAFHTQNQHSDLQAVSDNQIDYSSHNQFDSRIPNSLIEKKQQLEYQSNKFLENVPKKITLGFELMEEIYNDQDEEIDQQNHFSNQQGQQEIFGKANFGAQQKQPFNFNDQYQPKREMNTEKNSEHNKKNTEDYKKSSDDYKKSREDYKKPTNNVLAMFNSNNTEEDQFIEEQKQTFQNQGFFIGHDDINQKLDKILAFGENIFQMKQEQEMQNGKMNQKNVYPSRQYIRDSRIEQSPQQQIPTAQFERNPQPSRNVQTLREDQSLSHLQSSKDVKPSRDVSLQQSDDDLKEEIERQKLLIQQKSELKNSITNQFTMLSKQSTQKNKASDDAFMKKQNKSACQQQILEYNLPKVSDINKSFNHSEQNMQSNEIKVDPPKEAIPAKLEQIKQAESLELNVLDFNCLHEHLLAKFKQRNIFITCLIPSIFKSGKEVSGNAFLEDSYKEVNGEEFIFRQKFTLTIEINENNYNDISNSAIQFTLNSFIIPQKEVQDQKSIMMQIANGEFKMNKIFEQKSFSGNFYVNMWTSMPIDSQNSESQTKTAVMMKINKSDFEKNKQSNSNLLGQVKISITLILKRRPNNTVLQGQSQIENNNNNMNFNRTVSSTLSRVQTEQGLTYSQQIPSAVFNHFQILLRLGKLKIIGLSNYTSFNFFVRYKIYGTTEQVTSEISWDNVEPDFRHRLTIPCSLESVQKMLKLPFMIEVWNKTEKGEDQIIGMLKINMACIPRTILLPDFSGVNPNWMQSQLQTQLLIVCNENTSICEIADKKEKGLLFVTIAFGSPLQISKFDTNISQLYSDHNLSTQQRSVHQQNSSFYTNNSMKVPFVGHLNNNQQLMEQQAHLQQHQLLANQQGGSQTINVSNLFDHNKQYNSAQKKQQLNNVNHLNHHRNEDKQTNHLGLEFEEEEEIKQHSLTIKPESQIIASNRSVNNNEDDYENISNVSVNLIEKFVDVMQMLNQNMSKIQQKLKTFILNSQTKEAIQNKDFIVFLQSLEIGIKFADVAPLLRLFDSQKTGSFKCEYFSKSFSSFQRYEGQIRQKYQIILQKWLNILDACNLNDINKELLRQSEFGLMRKEKFVNIMKKLNLTGENVYEQVESICIMLDVKNDGLLFVSTLNDYLQSIDFFGEIKKLVLNYLWFFDFLQQDLSQNIIDSQKNNKSANPIEEAKQMEREQMIYQKMKLLPNDLIDFFQLNNSYWEAMMIISTIKGKKEVFSQEELTISGEQLRTYINATKFQTMSSNKNNKLELSSSTSKKNYVQEYSSNQKKRNIEINNISSVSGIDAVSNISQLGKSQMKKSIAQKMQEQEELELITDLLNNQVTSENKNESRQRQSGVKKNIQRDEFEDNPTSDNTKQNQIKMKPKIRIEFQDDSFERQERILEEEQEQMIQQKQNIMSSKSASKQEIYGGVSQLKQQIKKKFKVIHSFIVNIHKIVGISLGKDFDMENALLYYQFGDQDKIQIGSFDYFYGQQKYDINYQGEKAYKLSNEDDLENILIQENTGVKIDFEIKRKPSESNFSYISNLKDSRGIASSSTSADIQDKVVATADLSSFIILDIIQSSKLNDDISHSKPFVVEQCINLINQQTKQSVGKVQLSIIYQTKEEVEEVQENSQTNKLDGKSKLFRKSDLEDEEEECLLEKETKVKRLLPKQGYLNIRISAACSLKQQEIEWKNYKLVLFCDLFHENSYLSKIFKKLNSTASYNMTEEVLTIEDHIQITMSQELISYLQDNTCLVQLSIFPLDDLIRKSQSVVLGELYLNMQYLLIKQEINEECLIIKRNDIEQEQDEKQNNNETPLPISSSREDIGICSVNITYTKDKESHSQKDMLPSMMQQQKEMKNQSSLIGQNAQKDGSKYNYHQVVVLFDDILSLIEFDHSLITDQMCYFRANVNGNSIEGKDSFKMNFIDMKIQECIPDTYLSFLCETDDLQFINPLNIDIVARDMCKQQSDETILGHISIDFQILRKEFYQNLLDNNSMKCIKSNSFTVLRRNHNQLASNMNERQSSIEESIMKIRCNLRLLLVKYETKGDYEVCQSFLQQLILQNPSKNLKLSPQTDILEAIRQSLSYSRHDFDIILNYLTFDKQTLFNLLRISPTGQFENKQNDDEIRHIQKCILSQNECAQLIEDINIYDKKDSGIVDYEDLKKVLRKHSPPLREKAENEINKLDRHFTKIIQENVGLNMQKLDYMQFLNSNGVLSAMQQQPPCSSNNYQLKLRIEQATNVGILFNGVVPNVYIKCVQFGFTTSCILRDLNPQFDHSFEIDLQPSQFKNYHQVKFILYHRGYNSDYRDNIHKSIELGSAVLDLSRLFFTKTKQTQKNESFKIKIESSHYSAKNQNESFLHINVVLNCRTQFQANSTDINQKQSSSYPQDYHQLEQRDGRYEEEQKEKEMRAAEKQEILQQYAEEDNLIYNDEAFDNFQKTLMELREANEGDNDDSESYDYQQGYKNYQENNNRLIQNENKIQDYDYLSTLPKSRQFGTTSDEVKELQPQKEYAYDRSGHSRLQLNHQKDYSDVLLEQAMNDIDEIKREFDDVHKSTHRSDNNTYENMIHSQKDNNYGNNFAKNQLPKEEEHKLSQQEFIPDLNQKMVRFDKKNNNGSDEDELEDLRKTLQQLNTIPNEETNQNLKERDFSYKSQNNKYQSNTTKEDEKMTQYQNYKSQLVKKVNEPQDKYANSQDKQKEEKEAEENNNINNMNKHQYNVNDQNKFNEINFVSKEYPQQMTHIQQYQYYDDQIKQKQNTSSYQSKYEDSYIRDSFKDEALQKQNLYENFKQTQNELRLNQYGNENFETFKPSVDNSSSNKFQQNSTSNKPPIKRSDSQNSLKKLEKKVIPQHLKDSAEIDRISNIMKQDFSKSKKYFDYTSDSDDDY